MSRSRSSRGPRDPSGLVRLGKSTTCASSRSLIAPDAGEVTIDGVTVTDDTRTRVGYVVQNSALFPHLTARRNVMLPDPGGGMATAPTAERLEALAEVIGLDRSLLDLFPAELSGGQRQRVGLMRALILDPPVLLLDEPLGALDPIARAELQTELARIFREVRKTVVLVTHDVREAACSFEHHAANVGASSSRALSRPPAEPLTFCPEFLLSQTPPPRDDRAL